jgi:hypothetical protein
MHGPWTGYKVARLRVVEEGFRWNEDTISDISCVYGINGRPIDFISDCRLDAIGAYYEVTFVPLAVGCLQGGRFEVILNHLGVHFQRDICVLVNRPNQGIN